MKSKRHEIEHHEVVERARRAITADDHESSSDAMDGARVAWCAGCDAPVELDESGQCPACDEEAADPSEMLMMEPLPATSPRSIDCPLCGEDRGKYCRSDDNGNGYNHAARVEQFEAERGVLS